MGHCNINNSGLQQKERNQRKVYTRKDFTVYYFVKESLPRTTRGYPGEDE